LSVLGHAQLPQAQLHTRRETQCPCSSATHQPLHLLTGRHGAAGVQAAGTAGTAEQRVSQIPHRAGFASYHPQRGGCSGAPRPSVLSWSVAHVIKALGLPAARFGTLSHYHSRSLSLSLLRAGAVERHGARSAVLDAVHRCPVCCVGAIQHLRPHRCTLRPMYARLLSTRADGTTL
jgi:hypothetical protein